jgi:hypothetical protein
VGVRYPRHNLIGRYVALDPPEYAGRTYGLIDELFIRKVPARKFKSFECSGDYGRDLDMMVPQQLA